MANIKQPVTVGGIAFDALIDESRTYEADVPAYPVERGFEVSDTIILKPLSLSMTLYLTNTPVTWRTRNGAGPSKVPNVIRRLEALYFTRETVTVVTPERTYRDMAITSIELKKSLETGTSYEIPIEFQEIRVTEAATTTIPDSYGRGGSTGTDAGTAGTTSRPAPAASGEGSKGSILHGLASAAKLI